MTIYKDQLQAVRAVIEKPENWTQGMAARIADGTPTYSADPRATCWCLVGAAFKCDIDGIEFCLPLIELVGDNLATFNDTHTHSEVLALLDSAIERAPVWGGA